MKTLERIFPLIFLVLLGGCASQKQISYLQNMPNHYEQVLTQNYEISIHSDDLLSIMVNSKDPELAQMFNLPMVSYQITNNTTGLGAGQNKVLGYLVDKEGYIEFPVLGQLKVSGMTRPELTSFIKRQLIEKGLLNDPIVTVQFLNFRISVMGEVARPGTFEINSDRITLLEALSRAGDLTIYGKRDNVKIIREVDGKRTISTVDLRNTDIFISPYYYLQQNDIVYVEPNKAKAGQREINQNRSIGTWASIVSVLVSVAVLIFK
ncbi:MAG: polysaccharide biosynthesis/export family protein [Bacteroidales bacterium]